MDFGQTKLAGRFSSTCNQHRTRIPFRPDFQVRPVHFRSSQRDNPGIARRFNAGVLAHGHQSHRDG